MPPPRWLPLTLLAALAIASIVTVSAGAAGVGAASLGGHSLSSAIDDAVAGDRFSLFDFEARSVFNRWLGEVGAFVSGRRDRGAEADRILERYFTLGEQIVARATAAGEPLTDAQIESLRAERRELENRIERILESRIADAYRELGFSRPLPLFGAQEILWPPVDAELERPPRALTVSPREEIRLLRLVLLEPGLSLAEIERIEAEIEADGRFSAIVASIGGMASFPALVRDSRSYASTVEIMAHEWLHHYLYFYPLGRNVFASTELRSINETVADTIDVEIAARVFATYPGVELPARPPPDRPEADALLRRLRVDVDALLAEGDVEAAERLMEQVRLEIAASGRRIRRINQAFFAFNGVYATRPEGSTNPIGPLVRELRDSSPTLLDFVEAVREVDSFAELEALRERPR